MKIALHITSLDYLSDYLDMGIQMYIAGGEYAAFTTECFSLAELEELTKRVPSLYVMVNALYDEHELPGLFAYLDALSRMDVQGLLFEDFGVLEYVNEKHYHFDIMYAPQTLNTNAMTLNTLAGTGVSSAFIAKEIPLAEQIQIKKESNIPLMIQGHGVQYIMSSKRHLITNYETAASQSLDHDPGALIIRPEGLDFDCYAYEDQRGTTIYTRSRLYMLDLLKSVSVFDYFYIETLFMSDQEKLEVANAYADTLNHLDSPLYGKYVKEYMSILSEISKPLDRGFIEDQTIYHLDDVKRRDRLAKDK